MNCAIGQGLLSIETSLIDEPVDSIPSHSRLYFD